MESTVDTNGCTFLWNIENLSRWNWLQKNERITSPVFIANALGRTKWTLLLYPKKDEKFVGIYLRREEDCEGPEKIEVKYEFAFLDKTGKLGNETEMKYEFSKGANSGYGEIMLHEILFFDEIEKYIPGDTLSVKCTLWNTDVKKPDKSDHLFATTAIVVKRRCFLWKIGKPLRLKSNIKNKFEDYLISVDLTFEKKLSTLEGEVIIFDKNVKYISINVLITVPEEGFESYLKFHGFLDGLGNGLNFSCPLSSKEFRKNKSRYFPSNVLSFRFEFVLLTCENSDCNKYSDALESAVVGSKRTPNPEVLNYRYDDDDSKDVQLVIGTEIIRAHEKVLTARSIYFNNMFRSDMKESKSRCVNVGFEENTVREMLKYIYTGSLEDLNCDMACKLLEISNYYNILPLKSFCSSFLQDKLWERNVCEMLLLADKCYDEDLKIAAQNYILGKKQFLSSREWINLMNEDFKIAADVMHRKITTSDL